MRREDASGPDEERGGEIPRPAEPAKVGVSPKQVLIAIFGLILIAFAAANFDKVEVNFLLFSSQARLVTVIVVAAALGMVIGYFIGRPSRAQRRLLKSLDRD